jgi:hypothetical protein
MIGRMSAVTTAALTLILGCSFVGCKSASEQVLDTDALANAVDELGRLSSRNVAALYNLRASASPALRMSIAALDGSGRLTISEPFGSAVSMAGWGAVESSRFLDLRKGCGIPDNDLSAIFGVSVMPMPQAVRLLSGGLPSVGSDVVSVNENGWIEVAGDGWSARIDVRPDPWRVVNVEEITADGSKGWRVRLRDHVVSVPGWIRVEGVGKRWAELDLRRIQRDTVTELPALPSLPPCKAPAEAEP